MERLTQNDEFYYNKYIPTALCYHNRHGEIDDCDGCAEHCEGQDGCSTCVIQKCFDRLGEYEETGLTPEQIEEIDAEYTKQAKELMELRKKQESGGWIPADKLPKGDTSALVQVSGRYGSLIFDNALELAFYMDGKGWILENFPDWTSPRIIAWQPLPDLYKP